MRLVQVEDRGWSVLRNNKRTSHVRRQAFTTSSPGTDITSSSIVGSQTPSTSSSLVILTLSTQPLVGTPLSVISSSQSQSGLSTTTVEVRPTVTIAPPKPSVTTVIITSTFAVQPIFTDQTTASSLPSRSAAPTSNMVISTSSTDASSTTSTSAANISQSQIQSFVGGTHLTQDALAGIVIASSLALITILAVIYYFLRQYYITHARSHSSSDSSIDSHISHTPRKRTSTFRPGESGFITSPRIFDRKSSNKHFIDSDIEHDGSVFGFGGFGVPGPKRTPAELGYVPSHVGMMGTKASHERTGRTPPCSKAALMEEEKMKLAVKDEYRKEVYEMRNISNTGLGFTLDPWADKASRKGKGFSALYGDVGRSARGRSRDGRVGGDVGGSSHGDGRRDAMSATVQSGRRAPRGGEIGIDALSNEAREYAELTAEYEREWQEKNVGKGKGRAT